MELVKTLMEQQPLMALLLTIALGYLAGEINIKGFSLGVGAVLFVALAIGWFAPKSAPAPMVGTLGLALFLYAVGIQYGKQFFIGLTSAAGRRANIMALTGVLMAGAVSVAFVKTLNIPLGHALGLFAGSGTSNQHANPPGSHSGAPQRRCRGGLQGVLSVRRGRAHSVPIFRLHDPETQDPDAFGNRTRDARSRDTESGSVWQKAVRGDDCATRWGADRRRANVAAQRAGFRQPGNQRR